MNMRPSVGRPLRSAFLWANRVGSGYAQYLRVSRFRERSTYSFKREKAWSKLKELPEVKQKENLRRWLISISENPSNLDGEGEKESTHRWLGGKKVMNTDDAARVIRAGFATFLMQVETRIASYIGEGFYTIGPCGEELMAILGVLARPTDLIALHYRHLATQIARQTAPGSGKSWDQVLLDRARAPCISSLDPITGGHHCALGGGLLDFYVTSTLASQAPPAVGRAMGILLFHKLNAKHIGTENQKHSLFPQDAISIVSVGDGSINNGMFLSAVNLARYASHNNYKCPVLFVISNNDLCISLQTKGYLSTFLDGLSPKLKVFRANGNGDMFGIWSATSQSLNYVRRSGKAAVLVIDKITRRFGHAATDRQEMYLTEKQIADAEAADPMIPACVQALKSNLIESPNTLLEWFDELDATIHKSFLKASTEPKLSSRQEALDRATKPPLIDIASIPPVSQKAAVTTRKNLRKPQSMRVLMTEVYHELLRTNPFAVYVGEDVRHGGYYRVTEDLAAKFPDRVQDVPPDETSVMGLGIGYSQVGLNPIVEIPYAKYLDCCADLFFENALTYWCTNGSEKNGMLIRLQGFDKGVFGGNFHTHNTLYLPPGLDVVCYSNGRDYVRGIRYAYAQSQLAGRIVMSVDSTDLLYRKNCFDDGIDDHFSWTHKYPIDQSEMLDFETVILYDNDFPAGVYINKQTDHEISQDPDVIIFTYGNGVPTSIRAATLFGKDFGKYRIAVVDCPLLGHLSDGIRLLLERYPSSGVVFSDVCKAGQHPFGSLIYKLQEESPSLLSKRNWHCVAAPATYNPLGRALTFLSEEDVLGSIKRLIGNA